MPTAIVTGGNSGIGRATAVALAERGFDVGITWHAEQERADQACEEIRGLGVRAEAAQMDLDVTDANELPARVQAIDDLVERLGGVDAFVNNHGFGDSTPFLETELQDFVRIVHVDLVGSFLCLQKAARRMIQQGRGGRLIAITSVHEHVPLEGSSAYTSSKHGLGGLVKVMALELGQHGITVNAVAPGEIATRMTGQEDQDPGESEREGVPVGRPGHAREIGEAVAYLASPGARYTTGHSLVVDGGMLLMAAMANQLAQ
jgi:hypothetical protein